ncbi:hypothetical protein G7Z17_g13551 [Cylindrodendrum hubeiense]|uniref:Uncharacterized protein n=1 Tax=Cylindrodendrum hubeiense TaxID=595255 RepID=A0A9P5L4I0_9HYPO|nr:hypothetical protein G7Z17_g13551 [Cylindrodendrum hubeiense]
MSAICNTTAGVAPSHRGAPISNRSPSQLPRAHSPAAPRLMRPRNYPANTGRHDQPPAHRRRPGPSSHPATGHRAWDPLAKAPRHAQAVARCSIQTHVQLSRPWDLPRVAVPHQLDLPSALHLHTADIAHMPPGCCCSGPLDEASMSQTNARTATRHPTMLDSGASDKLLLERSIPSRPLPAPGRLRHGPSRGSPEGPTLGRSLIRPRAPSPEPLDDAARPRQHTRTSTNS